MHPPRSLAVYRRLEPKNLPRTARVAYCHDGHPLSTCCYHVYPPLCSIVSFLFWFVVSFSHAANSLGCFEDVLLDILSVAFSSGNAQCVPNTRHLHCLLPLSTLRKYGKVLFEPR